MTGISIFGAGGRMGRAIAEAVELRDDVRIAEHHPDVFVDFSVPEAVEAHLAQARRAGKPILIGTTGLTPDHHRLIDEAAAEIPLIYAANTSLGGSFRRWSKRRPRVFRAAASSILSTAMGSGWAAASTTDTRASPCAS